MAASATKKVQALSEVMRQRAESARRAEDRALPMAQRLETTFTLCTFSSELAAAKRSRSNSD